MKNLLHPSLSLIILLMLSQPLMALTFKTGEVLGPDGKTYKGMSPQNKDNLLANSKPGEIKSGINGKSFYVIVNHIVTTVPLSDLKKKTSEERMVLIMKAIAEDKSLDTSDLNRHIQPTQTQTISNSPILPTGENALNVNHMANNAESSILDIGPYSMGQSNSDATISMGNDLEQGLEMSLGGDLEGTLSSVLGEDLEHELEMALGGDLEHELEMALGGDLEHQLEMALGGDLMHTITDQIEESGGFDHVDSSDHIDSEDAAHDDHENADDHME